MTIAHTRPTKVLGTGVSATSLLRALLPTGDDHVSKFAHESKLLSVQRVYMVFRTTGLL
jgi:hypothetical protein